ncbi:unnamed protein product [Anisakis simplex]|uniref:Apple domain-containing protein n=1 Tax=Anisakis simplex TaxID=6269 RepID=A0A3P6RLJ8_ANISI|nr:unnamed protein product [Anisakis simplex]
MSTLPVNHRKSGELTPNRNSTYLEKLCLPSALAEKTRKIWPVVSNHILVGHVIEVTDAPSLTDCVIACLRAEEEFGFACKSAMWYPNDEDQNCLLNSESRDTQPDVFVAEDPDVEMIYLDVPRDNSDTLADSKPTRLRVSFSLLTCLDDPLNHAKSLQYTMWSSCANNATQMRHRYLKCKDRKDVRKCPKETVMCRHPVIFSAPQALANSECIAVRDSLGRRRCPHGIRILADGRNAYCKNPIDCE